MQKQPKAIGFKTVAGKIGKYFILAELALAAGSYGIWTTLNQSRDFRWKVLNKCPTILDYYYTTGEYLQGNNALRQQDYEVWKFQYKWTPEYK